MNIIIKILGYLVKKVYQNSTIDINPLNLLYIIRIFLQDSLKLKCKCLKIAHYLNFVCSRDIPCVI